ncbi:chemosensory receptor A [Elysia marginata]|uniref:Chemosensory receptor A n=1 Tax=Elysia marginata TaxID=1093978 RepID=A0AAV4I4Q4_9GAST|nr:chemosensory receptor A [Elysia marginata]
MVNNSNEIIGTAGNATGLDNSALYFKSFYPSFQSILSWAMVGVGFAGILSNVLTIIVYVKLGFKETINISYLALALSDLGCVLTAMFSGVLNTSALEHVFESYRIKMDLVSVIRLLATWPHIVFSKTTAILTAWISVQRCLCVVFPTKVRHIVSLTVTRVVITSIFVAVCCPVAFVYVERRLALRFDPLDNYTTLNVYGGKTDRGIDLVSLRLMYGFVYPILSWVIVTVCTTFLILRLRTAARWRHLNSGNQGRVTARETRVTKTIVTVATIFILCSVLQPLHVLANVMFSEYSRTGSLRFIDMAITEITVLLGQFNSSVNIIVFTVLGCRFRSVLFKMISAWFCVR